MDKIEYCMRNPRCGQTLTAHDIIDFMNRHKVNIDIEELELFQKLENAYKNIENRGI